MNIFHTTTTSKWLFFIVFCLVWGVITAAASELEILSDRLVAVGLRVERTIEGIRHDSQRGVSDREIWLTEIDDASRALDRIEARLSALPPPGEARLLHKLESLRTQLVNVQIAVNRPETDPPPPRPMDNRVVHKDRRPFQQDAVPLNDGCEFGFTVGYGSFAGSTTEATNDGQASCGSSINSPDVWFNFVPSESGVVFVDTLGSDFDAVVSVHSGCPGTIANELACDDDYFGVQASVALSVYQGGEYRIRISGFNGAVGSYVLNVFPGGEITGTVSDRLSGSPVVFPRVEAYDLEGYYCGSDNGDPIGTYSISGLMSGQYVIGTDLNSGPWVDEMYDDIKCPGGPPYGCSPTIGDPIQVETGVTMSGIDFALDIGGAISGVVLESGTQQGIEAAMVTVYDAEGSQKGYDYTDEAGYYFVDGLLSGDYFAVVTSVAWADELYDDIECPGGAPNGCDPISGTSIPVELNNTTLYINFELESLGGITGTVTDRVTGLPVGYADVLLYGSSGSFIQSVDADGAGEYQIGGLADGTYFVVAHHYNDYVRQLYDGIDCPSSGCDVTSGTAVVVADQNTVSGVDFDLIEKGAIAGSVRDAATLLPASNLRVRVYNEQGNSVEYGYTDAVGEYHISQLNEGTYFVATEDSEYMDVLYDGIPCHPACNPANGDPVVVADGVTTSGIDFDVVPLGKITGTVIDSATAAAANAKVELYQADGSYVGYDYTTGGIYMFAGLETAEFFVVAENQYASAEYLEELYNGLACWGGAPSGCDVTTGDPVPSVVSTVTSGIDFSLMKRASISGQVIDNVTQQGLSGTVYVENLDGDVIALGDFNSGSYLVSGLPPSSVRVVADTGNQRDEVWDDIPCDGEYPQFCDTSSGSVITVGPGDNVQGIDFSVDRLGAISGAVRDAATSDPLASYYVMVYNANGEWVAYDSTDSDGSYEGGGLWPGLYFVSTNERSWSHYDQLYDGIACPGGPGEGCDPTTGTPLTISFGSAQSGIDFDLERTATISGYVSDEGTGAPITSCSVQVWSADGELLQTANSNNTGIYTAQGLAPGTYYVATKEFYYSTSYLDELYDDIPCYQGPPDGCDPTKGTPVTVGSGQTARFVDFALTPRSSGILGLVTESSSEEPLAGVRIDVWDAATGDYERSVASSAAGTYSVSLDPGVYVVATDNGAGFVNQIFDGHECPPGGSAFQGDCDPMTGDSVVVAATENTANIDFRLRLAGILFINGFETGDTNAWSFVIP